ncbi:MAG TPA: type II 3-dehydroquinate dehydratase [bacterium]|jgi:3-dehydroquinate dehydratase-2|nr:type II 3-dehydroquinate dehydratase [bacterium]MDX9804873.1 type II 3-dehydroquinate dehydratase [bacterium]HNW16625.1 type II 3-dehydroquinate dehydratase [bacterium]HNZ53949.1 type II 3-dehydroquinate dehydratase [bacterium]HOG43005.1 type II 3-dehydroquinate dehydratase [bacterium]
MKICIIEGPLLDKVGTREPSVYGSFTRDDLVRTTLEKAGQLSVSIEFMNSYLEGELAGLIAGCKCDGMVLNPGAYTHTSVLIRDAALCSGIPFVEAHLTNIFGREDFRHRSFLSDIASAFICGLGIYTYASAVEALYLILKNYENRSSKT